jgi:CheY-like chemotaxis protein
MLVEDALDTRDLVTMILEMAGHEVVSAETGEAGLTKLENLRPEVILMDMSLPGKLSGLDVVKILRADASFDETPILALTAHAMPDDYLNSIAAGCDEHITKPIFDIEAFIEIISQYAAHGREYAKRVNAS